VNILQRRGAEGPAISPLRADLYRDGWIDLNKNGRQDGYETAGAPVKARVIGRNAGVRRATLPEWQ